MQSNHNELLIFIQNNLSFGQKPSSISLLLHFDQPHHLIVLLVGVDGIRAGVILIMTPLRIRSRFNLSSDDDTVSCQDYGISWVANTRPVNELDLSVKDEFYRICICSITEALKRVIHEHFAALQDRAWRRWRGHIASAVQCGDGANVWHWVSTVEDIPEHWTQCTVEGNLSVCFALWGIVAPTLVGREYLNILGVPRQTKLTWCYTITINTPLHPFEWVTEGDQKDKHTNHMCNCACVLYIVKKQHYDTASNQTCISYEHM